MAEQKDALTGLLFGIEDDLKRTVNDADSVSLVLLDVDHFMEINTSFGRDHGDRVLQVVGALLEEAFPGQAYRTAGDEFGALLPEMPLEQAFLRMESLRARVKEAADRFKLPGGRAVTITAGVANTPRDARDATDLLRKAYAALGAAKEGGRDQVSLAPNDDMVMKSCYYPASSIRRLKSLADTLGRKESALLREALNDLIRKYDQP